MAEEKKKLRVKVIATLKEDLEAKIQEWLDSTPETEEIKYMLQGHVGVVIFVIIFYKR